MNDPKLDYEIKIDTSTMNDDYTVLAKWLLGFGEPPKLVSMCTGTTDIWGNDYAALSKKECMDKLITIVESKGFYHEYRVERVKGKGFEYYFAPCIVHHLSVAELSNFFARIIKAIRKYNEKHQIACL